jgi:hypothetical protein
MKTSTQLSALTPNPLLELYPSAPISTRLRNTEENSEPSTFHQTGSAAKLGKPPSTFILEAPTPPTLTTIPDTTDDAQSDKLPLLPVGINPTFDEHDPIPNQHGPTPPTPHHVNLAHHQHRHSILQKMRTIYFHGFC